MLPLHTSPVAHILYRFNMTKKTNFNVCKHCPPRPLWCTLIFRRFSIQKFLLLLVWFQKIGVAYRWFFIWWSPDPKNIDLAILYLFCLFIHFCMCENGVYKSKFSTLNLSNRESFQVIEQSGLKSIVGFLWKAFSNVQKHEIFFSPCYRTTYRPIASIGL